MGCCANQNHKRGTTHCCIAVSILPPSRGGACSACRRTCYVVRFRPIALHVGGHEIVHAVAAASCPRYHMVCGKRQRVRGVATPIEGCSTIVARRSRPFGALAEDGAVAVVESRILAHYAITSLTLRSFGRLTPRYHAAMDTPFRPAVVSVLRIGANFHWSSEPDLSFCAFCTSAVS